MRRKIPLPVLGMLLLELLVTSSSSSDKSNDDMCGMYLAASTIPGAGMGVFAGHRNILKGDYLLEDDGDLVVPVYEMTKHVGHTKYSFLWEEYTWKAASFDGMNEEVDDVKKVKACSTGLGAAINCILPLVNVVDVYDERQVGLSGIVIDSRGRDDNRTSQSSVSLSSPGVGAFSPYYNRRWKAKRDITPGMEIYGNYGEGYFKSRSAYKQIPLKANFREVDILLRKYQRITAGRGSTMTEEQKKDLLIYLQSLSKIWEDSRNMHAIPQTEPQGDPTVVDWLLNQKGGSGMIHYNSSIRELDWLEKNGRCMDNIRDGISRIPHAGRGAFARRKIPQGAIVAPAPLIQIPDREVFTIYDRKSDKSNNEDYELIADHDKPVHQQLLLNYCFGHGESTLLLCPYGLMTSHINHDPSNPNTKVVWAADDQMAHPEWRKKRIEKWGTKTKAGLSFDFVAVRDIERDEEITIDYGTEWEEAWQRHLQSYYGTNTTNGPNTAITNSKESIITHHVPAFEMNKLVDMKLQTIEERDYEIEGLRLFCRRPYLEWYGVSNSILDDDESNLLVRDTGSKTKTRRIKRKEYIDWNNNEVFPCRIRGRYRLTPNRNDVMEEGNLGSYRYVAEIFERSDEIPGFGSSNGRDSDKRMTTQDFVWAVLFGVPRDAFYFEDEKNHRHHHQPWSFRHEMRIPDEIFPKVWRNQK